MYQDIVTWSDGELTVTRWKPKTIICIKCNNPFDVYQVQSRVCPKCQKKANDRRYYLKHQERLKEYTKNWIKKNQTLKKKSDKDYHDKNKEVINKTRRARWKRNHKPRKLKPFHKFSTIYGATIKDKARILLKRAVTTSRIIKPNRCSCCNRRMPKRLIHGHHEDYNKWWIIIWLCQTCHSELHLQRNLL